MMMNMMINMMIKKIEMTAFTRHCLPQSQSFNLLPLTIPFLPPHFPSLSLHTSAFINLPLLIFSLLLYPCPSNILFLHSTHIPLLLVQIGAQISDLRSVVCKEACRTAALLARRLGPLFSPLAELWLPVLFKLLGM